MKRKSQKNFETNTGISVIIDNINPSPCCPHGPSVLFKRHNSNRAFFACSAFRDKKDCNFFMWQEELNKNVKVEVSSKNLGASFKSHDELIATSNDLFIYCQNCNELMESNLSNLRSHKSHELRKNLSRNDLSVPSRILQAKRSSKKEAQFFFSPETISVFLDIIKKRGFCSVLCLGTPTIHEAIKNQLKKCESILMDFDERLSQFFPNNEFCHYNMFNHFFFKSKETYLNFLQASSTDLLVVTDPPFGGRYELVANTFERIKEDFFSTRNVTDVNVHLIWVFPYFFEHKISSVIQDIKMSDYQVLYADNSGYKDGRLGGRKQGSPVRLFTTIPLSTLSLAGIDGYKFCSDCNIWVSCSNIHCLKCGKCTGKNGGEYKHCDLCRRCVKQTWVHCNDCSKCSLPTHDCQQVNHKRKKIKFNKK